MSKLPGSLLMLCGLSALLAGVGGCKSTDPIAPAEGELRLSANPGTVVIDEAQGETEGQTTITAQILDESGFAVEDVNVFFSTTGGSLASASDQMKRRTDANGFTSDVLTLTLADPSSAEVTATSSALSNSITVEKTVSSGNVPPTASITANPSSQQVKGRPVTFSGLGSSDPDGQITCYQWILEPTVDAREVRQGPTTSVVSKTYQVEQTVTVTLRVSDDPAAASFCTVCDASNQAGCMEAAASNFSPDQDFINAYRIVCAITGPLADAGNDQTVSAGGGSVTVTLQGTATAGDAPIVSYEWDCSNGTPLQSGQTAMCTYRNFDAPNATVYTAELTVTDECGKTGTDRVNITVQP